MPRKLIRKAARPRRDLAAFDKPKQSAAAAGLPKIEATRLAKELSGHYREIGKRLPRSRSHELNYSEPARSF